MDVIFLTSNSGFPKVIGNTVYSPLECVGGYFFVNDPVKLELVQQSGLSYEIVPNEKILKYEYIEDPITGEVIKQIPTGINKADYYNIEDGESFYEKTLKLLNPLNWFK